MEEGGGRDRKRRRWRRHHKVWKAPFAIDLSPLAAILRSAVPHHASPWNTILFPLGRPLARERVSPLCLCVFARVFVRARILPSLRIREQHTYACMDLLSHLPLTTPLRHDKQRNTTAVIIHRIRIRICTRGVLRLENVFDSKKRV